MDPQISTPDVHALYNFFPLSMSKTYEYNEKQPL